MKRLFLYLIAAFLLTSCTSNTIYKKPGDLIPADTMKMLLTDMYVANSAKYIKNKFLQKDINYMGLVYEKYAIDSVRFKRSNFYYNSKIEIYEQLLKDVQKTLKIKRALFEKELKVQEFTKRLKKIGTQHKNHTSKDNLVNRLDSIF